MEILLEMIESLHTSNNPKTVIMFHVGKICYNLEEIKMEKFLPHNFIAKPKVLHLFQKSKIIGDA